MAVLEKTRAVVKPAVVKPEKAAAPIVEAREVDKRYDTGKVQVQALRGVNLAVRPRIVLGPASWCSGSKISASRSMEIR